jgi:ribosomal protein L11 methyltransferase
MADAIYLEFDFKVEPLQPGSDVLMAELGAIGFESFMETATGFLAYVAKEEFQESAFEGIGLLQGGFCSVSWAQREVPQQNWNKEWESNFEPIEVAGQCSVRAPFHDPRPELDFDLIIEPKMSFGTGHHATTHLMIKQILGLDLQGKTVLDMGCGTGVLGILAEKKGASLVHAIDIDNWCFENSQENVSRNACTKTEVILGGAEKLGEQTYDLIIANINRNVLLNDISKYAQVLDKKGVLLLSGFYSEDIPMISEECAKHGLTLNHNFERNNWIGAKYVF